MESEVFRLLDEFVPDCWRDRVVRRRGKVNGEGGRSSFSLCLNDTAYEITRPTVLNSLRFV